MDSVIFNFAIHFCSKQFQTTFQCWTYYAKNTKIILGKRLWREYNSDFLFKNKLKLKTAIITSRLGSALNSNAIKQESYTIGADWRFFNSKAFQLSTGVNGGIFKADYEDIQFESLTNKSGLTQMEVGLHHQFNIPINLSASVVYNIINSDGTQGAGTLFPLSYQVKLYYRFQ